MSTEPHKKKPKPLEGITSIARTVVAGSVIKTGDEGIAIGGGGIAAGRWRVVTGLDGVVIGDHLRQVFGHGESPRLLSQDQAFHRISAAVKSNLTQLERYVEIARKESNDFSKLILIFALLGILILFLGVGFLLDNFVTEGLVSISNAVIAGVTAVVFFRKDQERQVTTERCVHHISDCQRLLTMIDLAETIKDRNVQDNLKKEIIWKALDIEQPRQQTSERAPANTGLGGAKTLGQQYVTMG